MGEAAGTKTGEAPRVALQAGGTLMESSVYIERPEDERVYALLSSGTYCNVLTTRQMGKSSLMARVRDRLKGDGCATAMVDIAGDLGTPASSDEFYKSLLYQIASELGASIDVEEWWAEEQGTPNQRLIAFFRTLMSELEGRCIVFLDEIDSTLKLPFSDDLFTAIRTIHNRRQDTEAFRDLVFCLLGTARPSELIKERRTTPFNVGEEVELTDFDAERDKLDQLDQVMSVDGAPGSELVRGVFKWTDGHPYLTMALCRLMQQKKLHSAREVDELIGEHILDHPESILRGHFEWINTFLRTRLEHGTETFKLYRDVLAGRRILARTTTAQLELRLSGLVKLDESGFLKVRNRIYQRRFGRQWLDQAMPPRNRLPRWVAPLVGVLILVGLGAVGWGLYLSQNTLQARERVEEFNRAIEGLRTADEESIGERAKALRSKIEELSDKSELEAAQSVLAAEYQGFWSNRAHALELKAKAASIKKNQDEAELLSILARLKAGEAPGAMVSANATPFDQRLDATFYGNVDDDWQAVRFLGAQRVVALGKRFLAAWQVKDGKPLQEVALEGGTALALSRPYLAVGVPNEVLVYQLASEGLPFGTPKRVEVKCDDIRALSLAPSRAGQWILAVACGNSPGNTGVVTLIELEPAAGRSQQLTEVLHAYSDLRSPVYGAALSPSAKRLATSTLHEPLRVFELVPRGTSPVETVNESGRPFAVARQGFACSFVDEQTLIVGETAQASLYRFEGRKFRRQATFPRAGMHIVSVAADPGTLFTLAVSTSERSLVAWKLPEKGSPLAEPPPELYRIEREGRVPNAFALAENGERLVVAFSDHALRSFRAGSSAVTAPVAAKSLADAWQLAERRLGLTYDGEKVRKLWPEGHVKQRFLDSILADPASKPSGAVPAGSR